MLQQNSVRSTEESRRPFPFRPYSPLELVRTTFSFAGLQNPQGQERRLHQGRDEALGRVNNQVMDDEQVTRAELLEALRREGHASLRKVRVAVLENDGSITLAMPQS